MYLLISFSPTIVRYLGAPDGPDLSMTTSFSSSFSRKVLKPFPVTRHLTNGLSRLRMQISVSHMWVVLSAGNSRLLPFLRYDFALPETTTRRSSLTYPFLHLKNANSRFYRFNMRKYLLFFWWFSAWLVFILTIHPNRSTSCLLLRLVPAVIIAFIAIVFVPGPTVPKSTPKSLTWKRKLWELHTGWLGLALSLALAFITTNGMKNLFGRPRPDLLSRCQPDLGSIDKWTVGGISAINGGIGLLVSAGICQQTDTSLLDDGFRSKYTGVFILIFQLAMCMSVSISPYRNKWIGSSPSLTFRFYRLSKWPRIL